MVTSILRLFMLAAITAAIIAAGWNEPIRYRFMSASMIAEEERALRPPPPEPPARGNTWKPSGTALDRAPYVRTNRGVVYTGNVDAKQMGVSTESGTRPNLYR